MDYDTTDMVDTHMVDTTLENKHQQETNIKEFPRDIAKSKTNLQRRPLQPHWTCLCPWSA